MILRDKLRDDPPPVDYLLIDCPPSLGILTLNALAAVGEVFIPLQPHFLALHGLSKLLDTIDLVAARINDQLKLSGVILCMYDSGTRLAAEVGQDVEDFFRNARGQPTPWANAQIFQTRIRRNIRLAEAPSFGKSIFQYAPDSHGAEDYRQLAEEIVAQGQESESQGREVGASEVRGRRSGARDGGHDRTAFCPPPSVFRPSYFLPSPSVNFARLNALRTLSPPFPP